MGRRTLNGRRPQRHARLDVGTIPDNPYRADYFADLVLDIGHGGSASERYRRAADAADAHPRVVALRDAASSRREREALLASVSALVWRTVCP